MSPFDVAWQVLKEEGENFDVDNPMQVGNYATQDLPHITWMSPEKRTGWVNGNLMLFGLPQWAARNKHTASISTDEQQTPQEPPTEQEIAQQQFMSQMFDKEGNLR